CSWVSRPLRRAALAIVFVFEGAWILAEALEDSPAGGQARAFPYTRRTHRPGRPWAAATPENHAFPGHRHLRRHRRPEARRERGDPPATSAADQGRTRHRQDDACRGSRLGARHAAAAVAHQVDDEGAAG